MTSLPFILKWIILLGSLIISIIFPLQFILILPNAKLAVEVGYDSKAPNNKPIGMRTRK